MPKIRRMGLERVGWQSILERTEKVISHILHRFIILSPLCFRLATRFILMHARMKYGGERHVKDSWLQEIKLCIEPLAGVNKKILSVLHMCQPQPHSFGTQMCYLCSGSKLQFRTRLSGFTTPVCNSQTKPWSSRCTIRPVYLCIYIY